jgi:hypothetical protein
MSCIVCGARTENGVCYAIGGMEICLCLEHSRLIHLKPTRFILS